MRYVRRARAADANHHSWLAFSGLTRAGLSSFNADASLQFSMSRNSGVVKDSRTRALRLPAPTTRRRRRRFRGALPDRPVVELNNHAIRGIDRAEIGSGNPEATGVIHPTSGRLADLVDQVELPTVLGDEGEARLTRYATCDAPIWAGQIHALGRRVGCDHRHRHGHRTQYHSHCLLLSH